MIITTFICENKIVWVIDDIVTYFVLFLFLLLLLLSAQLAHHRERAVPTSMAI